MTIRRQPVDFIVRERLTERLLATIHPASSGPTTHALYELAKTSLSTPEAAQRLAGLLKIRPGMVEHAGLKDKHAHTFQHVSVPAKAFAQPARPPQTVEASGLSARLIGHIPDPIRAADIDANRFTIVVRDIARPAAQDMRRRAALLAIEAPTIGPSTLRIINYFGDQRFGSARHGEGWVAKHLIRAEFDQALRLAIGTPARKDTGKKRIFARLCATHWGDWQRLAQELPRCPERAPIEALAQNKPARDAFATLPHFTQQICIEAFQSHLWNAAARALAAQLVNTSGHPKALIHADDPYGLMLFPHVAAIPPDAQSVLMPMPAPCTQPRQPWGDALTHALTDEELTFADLRIPGLRRPAFGEAERPLFVDAKFFTLSKPEQDELSRPGRVKVTAEFELPRGAYATVLLRALGQ